MATTRGAAIVAPRPTSRPGTVAFADAYGSLNFGPTTAQQGATGPVKAAAADAAAAAITPVSLNPRGAFALLGQPAGVLVLLVVGLAVWSYVDRKRG